MALVAGTAPGNLRLSLNHGAGVASSPSWKLYHNPHYSYSPRGEISSFPSSAPRSRRKDRASSSMIVADFEDGDGSIGMDQQRLRRLGSGYGVASVSELVARVEELGAELEFERRMRRKVEALNDALAAELAEERRRAEAERARMREELDEERRTLRVAELWREERVRMKLADARDAVVERLREVADAGRRAAADAAAEGCGCCRSSGVGSLIGGKASPESGHRSPASGRQSPASRQHGQESPTRGQHGQQSPTRGQSHRREATGGENPHIRRGIKGSVEFPRAVRVRPRGEERVDLVSNLECQRAQLRVLMRHRSPATDAMGLADASPDNLVV